MNVSWTREIKSDGATARVPLTRGYESIIDAADIPLVFRWNWSAHLNQSGLTYGKRNRLKADGPGSRVIMLHRVIAGVPPDHMVIDHINGDGLDNRRANLRVVTQAENCKNVRDRSATNSSGRRGVYWDSFTNKWMAAIGHNGRFINLGRFDDIDEAQRVRNEAAIKYGISTRPA